MSTPLPFTALLPAPVMITLVLLALAVSCRAEADPKKSSKKSEKGTIPPKTKTLQIEKDSKTHKRGLYPDPILGSTYALPGAVPLEVYHSDCEDGFQGGVYGHLDAGAPLVAATYAPGYSSDAGHGSYGSYGHGYLGGFPGGLHGLEALLGGVKIEEGTIRVKTITTHVPVPVPQPVPVEVIKRVPVRVEERVPVDVPRAVPVEVPQPYPVEVEKPYPVEVPKPVPHLVPYPVHYKVPEPYPVEVPTPYAVEVHKPVPVSVPHPVEVHKPVHVTPAPYIVPAKQEVFYPTTPKPYYPSSTVVPAYTTAPEVVSVTKCDDDHGLAYPNPTSIPFIPSFAKDIFSVSSLKSSPVDYGYHPSPATSYHKVIDPVPSYVKASIPVVSITPVPVYSTAVTPVAVTPIHSYPKALTAVHSYSTPLPPTVSYPTSEPCDHEYVPNHLASYAHTAPVPSYPKAPSYNYAHTVPVPSYPKAPSYNYAHTAPVPSYPKAPSYNYGHTAAVPSYGYGGGVATSFVGMTSHGSSSFSDYKSQIHHPQQLLSSGVHSY